jgi:DNA polymerase-3 subunit beta
MKFTIEKNRLTSVLSSIAKGMASRSTLPILSGIYIEANEYNVVFQTTDLEVAVKHTTEALVEQTGATVVPGKLFNDIVKSFPDAAINIELVQDQAVITCMDSKVTLHTLQAADFPMFPQPTIQKTVSLTPDKLASMIKKVSKAVSKDESRAVLTGVLIKAKLDMLQLVATDSYRLAIAKTQLENPLQEELDIIVSGSILDEIARLISDVESVEISESDNQIIFVFGNITFITRKIEGNYPNYEQIVPTQKEVSATTDTEAMRNAVKRASILAQDHTPIKLTISAETQSIEVSSNAQDIGGVKEMVFSQIDGVDLEIGFNHQYIIDGLSVIDTEEVLFEAQTALKPGILKSVGEDYFFYLTMPVRLDR